MVVYLTQKEKMVLEGLIAGKNMREIANRMGVGPGAPYIYLARIRRKYKMAKDYVRQVDLLKADIRVEWYLRDKRTKVSETFTVKKK